MILGRRLHCLRRLAASFSSQVPAQGSAGNVEKRYKLQFSKSKLTEFGELPLGEIPEALKYDRASQISTLDNGVRVATEQSDSNLASITVAVRAGTRNETLETSGVASFIGALNQRGTQSRSREQVEDQINMLGGHFKVDTQRELQTYTLTFDPRQTEEAVAFLGDVLQNSLYNSAQIEAERERLYREATCTANPERNLVEMIHNNSFRDHFMSQPVRGIRENIGSVNEEQIKEFHRANFVGPNLIVSGVGRLEHERVVRLCKEAFGGLSSQTSPNVPNSETPYFTPSIMNVRDDELKNVSVGVFFNAPTWNDPDYMAMHFFRKLAGDYRADRFTGAHLNVADKQYNMMHAQLGNLPDVTYQKCMYLPYSDCGLFGNYLLGNEVFLNQMVFLTPMVLSEYASFINQAEVYRARAQIFNDLLSQENTCHIAKEQAYQVNYWGRRMPRSEFATRISAMDAGHLNRVATRNFWDKDISVVMWGPTHLLASISHYNRPWRRATLGVHAHMYYVA